MPVIIWKEVGETPLEALEKYRASQLGLKDVPMTYAGRLDPMAEGELLLLAGDECKDKPRYLGLDKEYEVEIVFGIETDTYDALGLVRGNARSDVWSGAQSDLLQSDLTMHFGSKIVPKYVGKFTQPYPPFSSRTFKGKPLHELARTDDLPEEMPTKEVEIYSIELSDVETARAPDLRGRIFGMIDKVKGDFRQEQIKARWNKALNKKQGFPVMRIRVKCSSGTYMRSLAHRIGKDARSGACALTIKRTRIVQI